MLFPLHCFLYFELKSKKNMCTLNQKSNRLFCDIPGQSVNSKQVSRHKIMKV